MVEHPFGWLSVLPPVAAIVLAIATRRVIFSLFAGIFVGALVLTRFRPIEALIQTLRDHMLATLMDEEKLLVFFFTMLMGVMVGVINRAAGMKGLVNLVSPLANNRKRGQVTTWFLGLFVFFDDYANTMLLGNTMRPLTDKLKIAREKLAYLVDSTAAPVAGLALISTWVAGEIGYVQDGIDKLPGDLDWNAFGLFLDSIPYRFYVLWALLFVPIVALMGRDFGPMLKAERDCIEGKTGPSHSSATSDDATAPDAETPARWYNAVIPVLITVGATIWFLYSSGRSAVIADLGPAEPTNALREYFGNADSYHSLLWGALAGAVSAFVLILPQRLISLNDMTKAGANGALKMVPALAILWLASSLSKMTGNDPLPSDAAELTQVEAELSQTVAIADVLADQVDDPAMEPARYVAEGLAGREVPVVMATLALFQLNEDRSWDLSQGSLIATLERSGYEGARNALGPTMVLLANTGIEVTGFDANPYPFREYRLYTGDFLSQLLGDSIGPQWMPTIVFILASFVAFSTGTSWGTMGIVMPLVIPLVYSGLAASGDPVSPNNAILLGSIASVLAGAIFGDHCSPISDTTILSSQASGCDHVAHVRTQLPYALIVAAISIVCGTIPIGFGVPVWIVLPIGVGLMLASLLIFGKRVEA